MQIRAEAAGPIMEALREVLDPWLGKAQWKQSEGRVTFVYRILSEDPTPITLRLKVEINTREHFAVHGFANVPFAVKSSWFEGQCDIASYELDELLGTKLRALYQRRKGRDLFDMATALRNGGVDPGRLVAAFQRYMDEGGHKMTRALFESNLDAKLKDKVFMADIGPLLAEGHEWDAPAAAELVLSTLCPLLPGQPRKRP